MASRIMRLLFMKALAKDHKGILIQQTKNVQARGKSVCFSADIKAKVAVKANQGGHCSEKSGGKGR